MPTPRHHLSSPSLVLAIVCPRRRHRTASSCIACLQQQNNKLYTLPPHPLSHVFPFWEQAQFYLLKSKPQTLNIGFLPTLQIGCPSEAAIFFKFCCLFFFLILRSFSLPLVALGNLMHVDFISAMRLPPVFYLKHPASAI